VSWNAAAVKRLLPSPLWSGAERAERPPTASPVDSRTGPRSVRGVIARGERCAYFGNYRATIWVRNRVNQGEKL